MWNHFDVVETFKYVCEEREISSKSKSANFRDYFLCERIHLCKYNIRFYFIPGSEVNAYLKQIKVILSAVKKYRIFSLVTNTIYIFSL